MKKLSYIIILSALILGACNMPTGENSADADATTIAQTAAAVFTHAAETAAVTGIPSATTVPAFTATPINTLSPTIPPVTATNTPIPCNRASFVKDVTINDGAEIAAGAAFTKTWRIKNNGSCTWGANYVVFFDSGEQMGAPASTPLGGTVAPGATIDISVNLIAPANPGSYQGNFKLRSHDNIVFGVNADAQGPFWVKVVVPNPTPTPTAVANIDLRITQIEYFSNNPIKQGEEITVKVSAYNGGNDISGAFTVEWWPANGAATPLGCSWSIDSMVAKGGKVLECTYTYDGCSTYTTYAEIDTTNAVTEIDETNNILEKIQVVPCN